jgi:hypothetical protein
MGVPEGLIRVTQGTPEPQGTPEQAQPLWGIILAVGQRGMQVPVEMPVPQARRGRRVTRQGPLRVTVIALRCPVEVLVVFQEVRVAELQQRSSGNMWAEGAAEVLVLRAVVPLHAVRLGV